MTTPNQAEGDGTSVSSPFYVLRLFVTGATANSVRAITNLKHICDTYLPEQYTPEVVDVRQQREVAEQHQIIALPLLIKQSPLPRRRLIGDMSDTDKVLKGLGIKAPTA